MREAAFRLQYFEDWSDYPSWCDVTEMYDDLDEDDDGYAAFGSVAEAWAFVDAKHRAQYEEALAKWEKDHAAWEQRLSVHDAREKVLRDAGLWPERHPEQIGAHVLASSRESIVQWEPKRPTLTGRKGWRVVMESDTCPTCRANPHALSEPPVTSDSGRST